MGNLRSVEKALEYVGLAVTRTSDPGMVRDAAAVILPGVGAFGDAMDRLTSHGLDDAVRETIAAKKPFLGICLGLQMLFTESEEGFAGKYGEAEPTTVPGLDIFPGRVRRLPNMGLKIPHMGWNVARPTRQAGDASGTRALLSHTGEDTRYYFVHSYYVDPPDEDLIAATTDYGIEFVSAIATDNLFACQFHPEKSSGAGLGILQKFSALIRAPS